MWEMIKQAQRDINRIEEHIRRLELGLRALVRELNHLRDPRRAGDRYCGNRPSMVMDETAPEITKGTRR